VLNEFVEESVKQANPDLKAKARTIEAPDLDAFDNIFGMENDMDEDDGNCGEPVKMEEDDEEINNESDPNESKLKKRKRGQ
jgi:hypothetical protein